MEPKTVFNLLKSRNPLAVALGIVLCLSGLVWAGIMVASNVNQYTSQYETKEDHKTDVEQNVSEFKKDVRLAILENNVILLNEIDKRMRRDRP